MDTFKDMQLELPELSSLSKASLKNRRPSIRVDQGRRFSLLPSTTTGGSSDATIESLLSCGISWQEMVDRLDELFGEDEVNIEEVEEVLRSYKSHPADWRKFAKMDKFKYTRNLVHQGTEDKFNLMLLCWSPSNQSSIHDHSDAHCFVKVLAGGLKETRYYWPHQKEDPDGGMAEKDHTFVKEDDVTYMSDNLGLHKIANPSHTSTAISLHLYSPPFQSCNVFDLQTGAAKKVPMTFWSKFGVKIERKRSERMFNVMALGD